MLVLDNRTEDLHESERRGVDQKGRTEATEVVEMLERMHAQPGEWFNVSVPVVEAVDVLVQSRDVNKSRII